jgi:hypothetical protein
MAPRAHKDRKAHKDLMEQQVQVPQEKQAQQD